MRGQVFGHLGGTSFLNTLAAGKRRSGEPCLAYVSVKGLHVPRLTKRQEGEIIEEFLGIDPNTFKVVSISLNRGRMLQLWKDGAPISHYVMPPRSPKTEIVVVWHLVEVTSLGPPGFENSAVREQLEARAAEMKRVRNADKA